MLLPSPGQDQTIVVWRTSDSDRILAIVSRLGMSPVLFGRPDLGILRIFQRGAKTRGQVQRATDTGYGALLERTSQEPVSVLPANLGGA